MNDTQIPQLDQIIYDLAKAAVPMGGITNNQIYTGVRDAMNCEVPIKNIDTYIAWLRDEAMLRPEGGKWHAIDFEPMMPLP